MKWRCRACGTVQPAKAHYRGAMCGRCNAPLAPDEEVQIAFECPFCHENVDANAKRCSACSRSFGVPKCGSCGAQITGDEDTCAECHAAIPREAHSSAPSHLSCPVCRVPLQETAIGRTVALGCATCSGAFIEHDVIERWTADRAADAPDDLRSDAPTRISDTTVRYRPCPRCAEWMNRINFGSGSGIILDSCANDGIWFDGGELASAIAFARSGKLDAAKKRSTAERAKRDEKPIEAPRSAGAILAARKDHRRGDTFGQWAISLVEMLFG
jgi:Zn-finger nucleic acid-binding protein